MPVNMGVLYWIHINQEPWNNNRRTTVHSNFQKQLGVTYVIKCVASVLPYWKTGLGCEVEYSAYVHRMVMLKSKKETYLNTSINVLAWQYWRRCLFRAQCSTSKFTKQTIACNWFLFHLLLTVAVSALLVCHQSVRLGKFNLNILPIII